MTILNNARPPRTARYSAELGARQASRPSPRPERPAPALARVPPAWGWKVPFAGRAAHVTAAPEYQATTTQVCGLFPYVAGSGTPAVGTPVGRHQLFGEVVCLDPLAWLRAGLTTNPGEFILGQPGVGKSTLIKRQITGAVATGTRALILGDTKPDFTMLVEHLGGQVIRVGRGLDRINPLDAGPLGAALRRMSGPDADALRWEVRSRRLSLLTALCMLVRGSALTNVEEVVLGRAIDVLDERSPEVQPTIGDVLSVLEKGPDTVRAAARADTPAAFHELATGLIFTLDLLCTGSLAGVFDGETSRPIDLDAPAVSVDISRVGAAGDKLLTAAMLCTWSYGFGVVDAAAALADQGIAPHRSYLAVMDELWRALRGAPGLVEHADALTRLSRQKGMGSIMATHSLADLAALPSPEDRAQARGFVERSAITVMGGLPPRELASLSEVCPMTGPEMELVTSWSSPDSWQVGARHPGRGKYLIKAGERLGIPVELSLVGAEYALYDTDQAIRASARDRRWRS